MKNSLLNYSLLVLVFFIIGCQKEDQPINNATSKNSNFSYSEQRSEDCEYKENLEDAFCIKPVDDIAPLPPEVITFFKSSIPQEFPTHPSTIDIFEYFEPASKNAKYIRLENGESTEYILPFKDELTSDIGFYVASHENDFILTSSVEWYVTEYTTNSSIFSKDILPLLALELQTNDYSAESISSSLGYSSNVVLEENYINVSLLDGFVPNADSIQYRIMRPCDYFEARTITKYIKSWGIEELKDDESTRTLIRDLLKQDNGLECGNCADPIRMTKDFLTFGEFTLSEDAKNNIKLGILKAIGISDELVDWLLLPDNINFIDQSYLYIQGVLNCEDLVNPIDVIAIISESSNNGTFEELLDLFEAQNNNTLEEYFENELEEGITIGSLDPIHCSSFQFVKVVPVDVDGGGWQAAQITGMPMTWNSSGFPLPPSRSVTLGVIEVGMPVLHEVIGVIRKGEAANKSTSAANRARAVILRKYGKTRTWNSPPEATLKQEVVFMMNVLLKAKRLGARVNANPQTPGIFPNVVIQAPTQGKC